MNQLVFFIVIGATFTGLDGQQFLYFCDPARCNDRGDCLLASPTMVTNSSTFDFSSNPNGQYPYQCRCEPWATNWNCSSTNDSYGIERLCFPGTDEGVSSDYPMFITFAETYLNPDGIPCSPQISLRAPYITSNTLAWVSYWCQGVRTCTVNTEWIASVSNSTPFTLGKFVTEVYTEGKYAKEDFKFCPKETQHLADPPLGSCFQLTPILTAEEARQWCWEEGGELSGLGDPTVIRNIVKSLIPNESETGVWVLNAYDGDDLRLHHGSEMRTARVTFLSITISSPLPVTTPESKTSTIKSTTSTTEATTSVPVNTTSSCAPATDITLTAMETATENATINLITTTEGTMESPAASTITPLFSSSSSFTHTDTITVSRGLCVFPAYPVPRPVDNYTEPKCPGKCPSGIEPCIQGQQGNTVNVSCPLGYTGVQQYVCTWKRNSNESHDYILDWTIAGPDNCVLQSCPLYNSEPFCRDACLNSTPSIEGPCPDGQIGTTTWQCWDNSTSAWSYEPSYDSSTCEVAVCPAVNTTFPRMDGLTLQWNQSLPGLLHNSCPAPYNGTVFFRCEENGKWAESGPNTRDCELTKTNGTPKQCPANCLSNFPNYCWNVSDPGIATKPCPSGKLGTAQWFCGTDGNWATDLPDMSNCKSNVTYFNDATKALNSDAMPPTDVVDNLYRNLTNITLVGGDISSISSVSRLALEKERALLSASTNETKNFTIALCNLTSLLLSDERVWWSIPLEKRRREFESVMTNTADSADLVSLYLFNETFQVTTSNLILRAENRVDGYFGVKNYNFTYNGVDIQLPENFEEYDKSNVTRLALYILSSAARILSGDQNKNYIVQLPVTLLSTPVLGVAIGGQATVFQNGTFISLRFPIQKHSSAYTTEPKCEFFDWNTKIWSDEGCWLRSKSDPNSFVCECDHLTDFAILMDITGLRIEKAWLDSVTVIGCSASVVSLLLSMCIYHSLKARNTRYRINMNIFINMLVAEILFLSGNAATASASFCACIAAAMQFFFLAMFMWMSLGAFHLYEQITRVFHHSIKMLYFYFFGYGVPLAIVTITLAVNQGKDYGTESFCWLDTTASSEIIWSFAGPVAATVLWNASVVVFAVYRVLNAQNVGAQKAPPSNWTWVTGSLSLSVLFGVTWMFGFFYVGESTIFMVYIFTIVNSFQGLFVFLFECIINPQVKNEWLQALADFKKRITAPLRESWLSSSNWASRKTETSIDTFDLNVKLNKFSRLVSFQTVRRLGVRLWNTQLSFTRNSIEQLAKSDSIESNTISEKVTP